MEQCYYHYSDERGLRHAHEFPGKPGRRGEHWHNANATHNYPYVNLHNDLRAYESDAVEWSRQNNGLLHTRKVDLLELALAQHDRSGGYYWRSAVLQSNVDPTPTLRQMPPPKEPEPDELAVPEPVPTPAEPATPASEDEIVELLASLPARVDTLEADAKRFLSDDMDLRGQVANINSRTYKLEDVVNNRFPQVEASVDGLAQNLAATGERITKLEAAQANRLIIEVREPGQPTREIPEAVYHSKFPLLLKLARHLPAGRCNIWITGPAGSGKTTAANQVAEVLGRPYYAHGATLAPFDVSGFRDVNGNYQPSEFRKGFEHGGVVLLDEIDAWSQEALIVLNAALSNGHMAFPDKTVNRHPHCIVVGSANTWGFGGDGNYMARNKMDVASLDRFVTISWGYDENFETQLATNDEWCRVVQAVRAAAVRQEAQIVISPRATLNGCDLLNSGEFTNAEVVESVFGRYRDIPDWSVIGAAAEAFANKPPAALAQAEPAQPAGTGVTAEVLEEINELVHDGQLGRKIAAIKLYREAAGVSLIEAKDFIDRLAVAMQSSPAPSSNGTSTLKSIDFSKAKVW